MPTDDRMPTDEELRASIREFENRPRYGAFTLPILAAIVDDDLELAIQDYAFSQIGSGYTDERAVRRLPPGIRAIYTSLHVEAEVNNGGFNQYFWNSEANLANLAVEGFQHIGAPEYADLMLRAIAAWKAERETVAALRQTDTLESFSESYAVSKLAKLDDEFYALGDASPLSKLRISFIRSKPYEFVTA